MAEGYSICEKLSAAHVEERDVKYFEFLAEGKRLPNWTYNASTKIITASPKDSFELEVFKEVIAIFERRVSAEVTTKRLVSAVRSFFNDQKRRSQFDCAHPVFPQNECDKAICTLFASNWNDLDTLQEMIKRLSKDIWSPEIISPRFRLTAHREVFVCTGDIVDYDEKDAGIVNPVVTRSSGQIEGRGKIFERLKEAGGDEYMAELNAFDGSDCVTTKGGYLDSLIIHPTRKVMNDQTKKDSFVNNLKDCLHEAQKANLQRLILPLVYSGSGGVSLKECSLFYACAIYEFCRENWHTYLGPYEIYFVEHDKEKAVSLVKLFNALFPTSFTQLMVIPKDYDSVMAAHVYVNQPHPTRVSVDDAYETIELREKEETANKQVDNFDAVPGRRSTQFYTKDNKQSVRISAQPVNEDIDSDSVCAIDIGPAQTDNTLDNDVLPKTANENDKHTDRSIEEQNNKSLNTSEAGDHTYVNVQSKQYKSASEGHSSTTVVESKASGTRLDNELSNIKLLKDECLFEKSKTKLVIKTADIREEDVDMIVCPEYQDVEFKGFVPNAIRCAFGIDFETIEEKVFKKGRVATSHFPVGPKKARYVYHVKASLFECGRYPISKHSEERLRQTVEKVFDKLHRVNRNINTIAFPLIGAIDANEKTLVKLLCSHFINVLFNCCDKRCDPGSLKVVIVNHCKTITDWLQESLYKKWNDGCN